MNKEQEIVVYTGQLDKNSQVSEGKHFSDCNHFGIKNFDSNVASCICARYYKGLSAHGDNLIIVEEQYE